MPAIVTQDEGLVVAERVLFADGPLQRARGLLGRPPLDPGEALLIVGGGGQVHTFGLSYALDVLFVDREWRVIRATRGLRPRRITRWVGKTRYVIELRAGSVPAAISSGTRLMLRYDAPASP